MSTYLVLAQSYLPDGQHSRLFQAGELVEYDGEVGTSLKKLDAETVAVINAAKAANAHPMNAFNDHVAAKQAKAQALVDALGSAS